MAFPTVTDRNVQYPSRVELTEVDTDVYDLTPVPGTVVDVGTPIDASLFASIQAYIDAEITSAVAAGIAEAKEYQERVELWSGAINEPAETATLSESLANFSKIELEVVQNSGVLTTIISDPSDKSNFVCRSLNVSDGSTASMTIYEMGIDRTSDTLLTISRSRSTYWDGSSSSSASISDVTSVYLTNVYGIR